MQNIILLLQKLEREQSLFNICDQNNKNQSKQERGEWGSEGGKKEREKEREKEKIKLEVDKDLEDVQICRYQEEIFQFLTSNGCTKKKNIWMH